jgi:hypothetical protein
MRGLLSANRGFVIDTGKRVYVTSSRPRTPTVTIHDGLLVGALEFRGDKPKRELVNRSRVRFVASEREYNFADGPTLDRADLQEEDGEILESTTDLPFTLDHRRAQRLNKAALESGRLGESLTCRVDLTILTQTDDALEGAVANVDSELFSMVNGTYIITTVAFAEGFSVLELTLLEYDPSIESNWNYPNDEQSFELDVAL